MTKSEGLVWILVTPMGVGVSNFPGKSVTKG